jgi:hypothetical protein
MRKQLRVLCLVVMSLVLSFTCAHMHVPGEGVGSYYNLKIAKRISKVRAHSHTSNISDPSKRPTNDRYLVRTKAFVSDWNWQLVIAPQWTYRPIIYVSEDEEHYSIYSAHFISRPSHTATLRGPPTYTTVLPLV